MTSSAKQTEKKSKGKRAEPSKKKAPGGSIPHPEWVVGGTLVLAGWILIAYVNRWYFGAPVFFLCAGWLAILLIGRFLWTAGVAAAELDSDDEGFVVSATRREELVREKKMLLKAIKEVEFDHQLGKMSDRDAEEITKFYRARAIEIIKTLERIDRGEEAADGDLSVQEKIEREVRARMTVLGSAQKGERQAEAKKEKTARKAKKGKKLEKPKLETKPAAKDKKAVKKAEDPVEDKKEPVEDKNESEEKQEPEDKSEPEDKDQPEEKAEEQSSEAREASS